ncbi:MAG: hypothetical protein ACTHOB_10080 [Ginsengibacter sp.]
MSSFLLEIALNYSIIGAAIIGIIRFQSIIRDYYPFIFIIWLGVINETLSLIFIFTLGSNTVNSNIFVLLEYLLVVYQFYKWNDKGLKKYVILALLGLAVWSADNLILNSIHHNNSLFRAFYSFLIVFFSIDQVNKLIIYERGPLLKNPMFIICITFLLYYGFKAFVESYNMFHLGLSKALLRDLWIILYFVNGIANLLYALAVLWIPTKVKFILPY